MPGNEANRELTAVLQHQKNIALVEETIKTLGVTIASQEAAYGELAAIGGGSVLDELLKRREDLLAELAIGQGDPAELDLLDNEIEREAAKSEEETSGNGSRIGEIAQTVSGLRRKLAAAEAECCNLERERYYAITSYLKAEAEKVGATYAQAATQTTALHLRLLALNELLSEAQPDASIEPHPRHRLTIPLFKLDSLRGMESTNYPGEFWAAARTTQENDCLPLAVKAEREKVSNAGVVMF